MMRRARLTLALAILIAGCARSPLDGTGGDAVSVTAATTAPSAVTSSISTIAEAASTTAPSGGTATSDETTTPSDETTISTEAGGASPEGATGRGVVTVDDKGYDVEVLACGWRAPITTDPLETAQNRSDDLQIVAIAKIAEDGFFAFTLSHQPPIPFLEVNVVRLVASAQQRNYWWSYDGQHPRRVVREGQRVWTPESLIVFEDPVNQTSPRHGVTFDITCDTYGGQMEDIVRLAAETTGLPFEESTFSAAGSVVIDGVPYEVTTTSCDHQGNDYSLVADSEDGSLQLVLTVSPLSDKIFAKLSGNRLVNDGRQEIVVDGDVLKSSGSVPLVGQLSGESAGDITFEVTCG